MNYLEKQLERWFITQRINHLESWSSRIWWTLLYTEFTFKSYKMAKSISKPLTVILGINTKTSPYYLDFTIPNMFTVTDKASIVTMLTYIYGIHQCTYIKMSTWLCPLSTWLSNMLSFVCASLRRSARQLFAANHMNITDNCKLDWIIHTAKYTIFKVSRLLCSPSFLPKRDGGGEPPYSKWTALSSLFAYIISN